MPRKASAIHGSRRELSSVQFDVLRLVARDAAPPANADSQVEKLVRLDLMFRGKRGYKLTAIGQELVDSKTDA